MKTKKEKQNTTDGHPIGKKKFKENLKKITKSIDYQKKNTKYKDQIKNKTKKTKKNFKTKLTN